MTSRLLLLLLIPNTVVGGSQECGDNNNGPGAGACENDLWTTWSDILKNWDKRKTGNIKVENWRTFNIYNLELDNNSRARLQRDHVLS